MRVKAARAHHRRKVATGGGERHPLSSAPGWTGATGVAVVLLVAVRPCRRDVWHRTRSFRWEPARGAGSPTPFSCQPAVFLRLSFVALPSLRKHFLGGSSAATRSSSSTSPKSSCSALTGSSRGAHVKARPERSLHVKEVTHQSTPSPESKTPNPKP